MKKLIIAFLGVALFFGMLSQNVKAQSSITAQAYAEVIAALTATETSQLNFGRFSPEQQGGQINLSPQGELNASGSLVLAGGTHNPASFNITGQTDASFSISLPSTPAILTNFSNSKTMTVSGWESLPPAGIGAGVLKGGSLAVNVGATLTVGSMNDNPVGVYSGTYSITFAYN
jgi:hypothetical protein